MAASSLGDLPSALLAAASVVPGAAAAACPVSELYRLATLLVWTIEWTNVSTIYYFAFGLLYEFVLTIVWTSGCMDLWLYGLLVVWIACDAYCEL